MSATRVVVVGGGFGGLAVARGLNKTPDIEVTLIDRHNYSVFKPLLAEVATGSIYATDAVVPLRHFVRSAHPIRAEVTGLDTAARRLSIRYGGAHGETGEIDYDTLVLALGGESNYFGIDGLAEHALTLADVDDALALRHRVLGNLEHAEMERDPIRRRALETFVIGGGSFTGVEAAGALTDYLKRAATAYPAADPGRMRVIVVEMKDELLSGLPGRVGEVALAELRRRGVDVRLGVAIDSVDGEFVALSDGTRVPSRMVLWAGGVHPSHAAAGLGLPTDKKGRISVDETLRVQGEQNVYALGDVAAVPDGAGGFYPPTAQHAEREGRYLAAEIGKRAAGRAAPQPFRYSSAGMLVALGERRATGDVRGHVVSGLPGWVLWRGYYLTHIPTAARKLRVAVDWALGAFTGPALVELPVARRAS